MKTAENHTIHFSSKFENIVFVEKLIEDVFEEFNIKNDYYGNVLVAVTEAVNNAIQHGNKLDETKSIDVMVEANSEKLSFIIRDEGTGFDYTKTPDPTDPQNIKKLNGRGLFLIKHLADKTSFRENGSVLELNFKIFNN